MLPQPHKHPVANKVDNKTQNIFTLPYIFEAWRIKFDKIYTEGNSDELHNTIISFSYEFYHVIGTIEFLNIIKNRHW